MVNSRQRFRQFQLVGGTIRGYDIGIFKHITKRGVLMLSTQADTATALLHFAKNINDDSPAN
jgi:hypothetical protein